MKQKKMILPLAIVLISLALLSLTPTYAAKASRWSVTFLRDIVGSGKLSSNSDVTYFSGSFPLTFGERFNSYAGCHGDCLIKILRIDGSNRVDVIVDFDFVKTSTGKTYKSLYGFGTMERTDSTFTVASCGTYTIYEIATVRGASAKSSAIFTCTPIFTISGRLVL